MSVVREAFPSLLGVGVTLLLVSAAHTTKARSQAPADCTLEEENMAAARGDTPHVGLPGTNRERSFLALKPDAVQRGLIGDIISRFEKKGFQLVGMKMLWPTKEQAEGHYADLSARPFFPALVNFFTSGPIVAMVWQGKGVVLTGRKMMGETDPAKSAPGSIRGDFSVEMGRNIIHGSDGVESAQKEIAFWFKEGELCDWTPSARGWVYE